MGNGMTVAPEVDRLVADFFAQALIRDTQGIVTGSRITRTEVEWVMFGMKPPTVPADLFELISEWRQNTESVSVLQQVKSQWRERLGAIAQKIERASYEERVTCLAPIDRLKLDACDPQSHPTEATLVAKMYLDGTYGTPRDPKYALHLLLEAADHGNAEAAYLLATARADDEAAVGLRKALAPFLLDDAKLREEYRKQARAARFQKVLEDEEKARWYEDFADQPVDQLREQLEFDPDYVLLTEEYKDILPRAQSGDSDAQLGLAMNLLAQVKHLVVSHYELWKKDETTRQQIGDMKTEARNWLLQASPTSASARYQLAMRFAEAGEERFTLLHSAAYQAGEALPCPFALVPLATDFYMDPASTHHDFNKGLACLRQYLAQYNSISLDLDRIEEADDIHVQHTVAFGLMREDAQAALCLADHVSKHPQDARGAEAYIWYSAVAANTPNAAYAALQAGLKEMRGQGCEKDLGRTKELFDLARKSHPSNPRDARAVKYADALYRLGFELPGHSRLAVDLLLELAEETEFKGDPECSITPADIEYLVSKNPDFQHYHQNRKELRSYRNRISGTPGPYGLVPLYPEIAQGLIWAIQAQTEIPLDLLTALLDDDQSILVNYVWAKLALIDRIAPPIAVADAVQRLEKISHLWNEFRREDNPNPPDYHEREIADSISQRAYNLLRMSATLRDEKIERAREETRREVIESMLAMFAHKLRGPIDSILFNTVHQHDQRIYIDSAQTMNGLMDMASAVSTSPERISNNCQDDMTGNGTPLSVLIHSLKQALVTLLSSRNRLRMSPHYLAYAKRQGAAPGDLPLSIWMREKTWISFEQEIQSKWEDDMGRLLATADIEMMSDWMAAHILPLSVRGFQESHAHFSEYGLKASLLSVIFQEVFVNAIKHSTPGAADPIHVSWMPDNNDDGWIKFTCANPSSLESRRREKSKGSGRGHKFLALLAENLRGRLSADVMRNDSTMCMYFPRYLFEGDCK